MTVSTSALSYVLFDKACELRIDLILLTFSILYIIQNRKDSYSPPDSRPVIDSAVHAIEARINTTQPNEFSRFQAQHHLAGALMSFAEQYATRNLVGFVFENCKREIEAVEEFYLMRSTGFSEADMLTVIKSHLKDA